MRDMTRRQLTGLLDDYRLYFHCKQMYVYICYLHIHTLHIKELFDDKLAMLSLLRSKDSELPMFRQ